MKSYVKTYEEHVLEGLVSHAEAELRKAGMFDADADYNGMIGKAVMDLVKVFADQGPRVSRRRWWWRSLPRSPIGTRCRL